METKVISNQNMNIERVLKSLSFLMYFKKLAFPSFLGFFQFAII
jgi:hypothetical protein